MRKAMSNVNGKFLKKKYDLFFHNCHHYKKQVDKEYKRLGGKVRGNGVITGQKRKRR
ncbi:MAG: hypothetical protein LBI29_02870 [Rickettsiales bacterium]|jgi:hypothetical protein|nr:hypothetical protein [Rickettsiales bacterium]